MGDALRALGRPALVALVATVVLDLWIRGEPLAMSSGLQVALSVALVAAVIALLALALRAERTGRRNRGCRCQP